MKEKLKTALRVSWKYAVRPGLILAGCLMFILGLAFLLGRNSTQSEWEAKVSGLRQPAEMRGLLSSLADFRSDAPNFLPQSSLDDEVCAAAITNAVNFILGEDRLKSVPAWTYSRENAEHVEKIYNRQDDFEIQGDKVVEVRNRGFSLTRILDPAGLYILAYHYRDTRSDAKIVEAGVDYNSHLMLLLPRTDGRWWGYHLVHYPNDTLMDNPARVEPVDVLEGDAGLDLVHIMRVKGISLPPEGEDFFLLNYSLHYSQIRPWLGGASFNSHAEYVVDSAIIFVLNLWNGTEQFPMIVDLNFQDLVDVPYNGKLFHGKILGFYNKNPIYFHVPGHSSDRGPYGLQYQCVEYANRHLASLGYQNMSRSGHADSYYWDAEAKGLRSFQNGGSEKPAVNDLLVFDGANNDGNPGHVAVIYSVTDTYVCFTQQNVGSIWRECLEMKRSEAGGWQIPGVYAPVQLPVIGWSRVPTNL